MAEKLKIFSAKNKEFNKYGRIIKGFDCGKLMEEMQKTPLPAKDTIYVPSDAKLEKLEIFQSLQDFEYGGLPIQIGYCNGNNHRLNAFEYHRSSEINIAVSNLILLVGSQQDIDAETYFYNTALVRAFFVPAGSMVELYATTLHFAPCNADESGFRDAVVLPRGTNLPLENKPQKLENENRLLFAKNKWLIAHKESGMQADSAFIGLNGENISV